jgi:hypothetical protein
MLKNQTRFFSTALFLAVAFIFITGIPFSHAQTNTTVTATSGALITSSAQERNRIVITVSGAVTADRVAISNYIGEGTESRALLGQAIKISGTDRWQFTWDVTAVKAGTYRVFAVIVRGASQTETAPISVKVGTNQTTTSTTTPSIIPTSTPTLPTTIPTQNDETTPVNLDTLSTIVNESAQNFEKENTTAVQTVQKTVNTITSALPATTIEQKEIITKNISDTITEVRQIVRDTILLGDEASIETIRSNFEVVSETQIKRLETLAKDAGAKIDTSALKEALAQTIDTVIEGARQTEEAFKNRGGVLLYLDTDRDNVSDYDEKYIYKTDAEATDSDNDGKSDGDEILAGTSPLSSTNSIIAFADPFTTGGVTNAYTVTKIEKVETKVVNGKNVATKLRIEGRGLPNGFITIYIYSSPIVVTVKANAEGNWQYILDKELEDGNHTVFVASVDTTGKILAKNAPRVFVKQADAVELLAPGTAVEAPSLVSSPTIIAVVGGVVFLGLLSLIYISYQHKKKEEEINKLGASEVLMTGLQPKENWQTTGSG